MEKRPGTEFKNLAKCDVAKVQVKERRDKRRNLMFTKFIKFTIKQAFNNLKPKA